MCGELQKNGKNDIVYLYILLRIKEAAVRKRSIFKTVGIIFLSVACLAAFLLSPVFRIETVTVKGNQHYAEEELAQTLSSVKGKNYFFALFSNVPFSHLDYLFQARLYNQEQTVIRDKVYVKYAEITCDFPDKVQLEVTERTPAFLIRCQGQYLLADTEGYSLEVFTEENKPDYPVVEGLETENYKIGKSLKEYCSSERLELAVRLCSLMEQSGFLQGYIDIIDITNPRSVWMFASPSLSVKFGDDTDLSVKISTLKSIFESGYDGTSNGTVDFTSGKNPIFINNEKPDA